MGSREAIHSAASTMTTLQRPNLSADSCGPGVSRSPSVADSQLAMRWVKAASMGA